MNCVICGQESEFQFKAQLLKSFEACYFKCGGCGLLQTEKPFWLEQAYQYPITDAYTGLVSRNILFSKKIKSLLRLLKFNGPALDYAGGYGLFVRLMRDQNLNFFWQDKYCQNLFAKEFIGNKQNYQTVTAFEVVEHLEEPMGFFRNLLNLYSPELIICSTLTFSGSIPEKNWWYYDFDNGQHISLYQPKTFQYIAEELALFYSSYKEFHLLSKKPIGRFKTSLGLGFLPKINNFICG